LKHGYRKLPIIKTSGYVYYDNKGFSKSNLQERDKEIQNIISFYFGALHAVFFFMKVKIKDVIRKMS